MSRNLVLCLDGTRIEATSGSREPCRPDQRSHR